MKTKTNSMLLILFGLASLFACQQQSNTLTDKQKNEIADQAKSVVQKVLESSNQLDFNTALQFYSNDSDTRYIENGSIFSSLDEMKKAYDEFGPALDLLENTVERWDIIVLSDNTVAITTPISFKIKVKELPEYQGKYVWSGIIQKRDGVWKIIQSHESWFNYTEVMAALTPPTTGE